MTMTSSGGPAATRRGQGAAAQPTPLRRTASTRGANRLQGAVQTDGRTALQTGRQTHRADAAMAGFVTSVVSVATGVEADRIFAATRQSAPAARARHMAMYLAHVGFAWPLSRVGAAFGRDRTTASHAVHLIEDLRDQPLFDAALDVLEACVRAGPPPLLAAGLAESP